MERNKECTLSSLTKREIKNAYSPDPQREISINTQTEVERETDTKQREALFSVTISLEQSSTYAATSVHKS